MRIMNRYSTQCCCSSLTSDRARSPAADREGAQERDADGLGQIREREGEQQHEAELVPHREEPDERSLWHSVHHLRAGQRASKCEVDVVE